MESNTFAFQSITFIIKFQVENIIWSKYIIHPKTILWNVNIFNIFQWLWGVWLILCGNCFKLHYFISRNCFLLSKITWDMSPKKYAVYPFHLAGTAAAMWSGYNLNHLKLTLLLTRPLADMTRITWFKALLNSTPVAEVQITPDKRAWFFTQCILKDNQSLYFKRDKYMPEEKNELKLKLI